MGDAIDVLKDAQTGGEGAMRPDRLNRTDAGAGGGVLDQHVVAHLDCGSLIASQYRAISTRLRRSEIGVPPASILFTSALPGEGKTTTVLNLGVELARSGKDRVVVVDANLRTPAVHRMMGVEGRQGLYEYLSGTLNLGEALVPGPNPNLALLPAGRCGEHPIRTLSGAALPRLLERRSAVFHSVLIDTPPLVSFSDAAVIAPHTDGVVLVIRAGRTPRAAVAEAQYLLGRVNTRCLGAVLTHVAPE